jgi:hypothetical protein
MMKACSSPRSSLPSLSRSILWNNLQFYLFFWISVLKGSHLWKQLIKDEVGVKAYFSITGIFGVPSSWRRRPKTCIWACLRTPDITCFSPAYSNLLLWIHGWKICLRKIQTVMQNRMQMQMDTSTKEYRYLLRRKKNHHRFNYRKHICPKCSNSNRSPE